MCGIPSITATVCIFWLEQFVAAQLEIESIQAETVAKLAATTDEQMARELRQASGAGQECQVHERRAAQQHQADI
jgi:hypothetical protein